MLMIRLQRTGKRGQAYFRVVILEHTSRPQGKYLELLGTYNPHQKEFRVKKDRIEYWVSKGAQVSPTVNNLMVNYKVWNKPKMQSWKPKKKMAVEATAKPKEASKAGPPATEPTSAASSGEASLAPEEREPVAESVPAVS